MDWNILDGFLEFGFLGEIYFPRKMECYDS